MADGRAKAVLEVLADIYSRGQFAVDTVTNLSGAVGYGDIIDVPSISALTVTASGATTTAPQAVTTNVLSLNVNLDPMINALMPRLSRMQLMNNTWAPAVAKQAMIMLKNSMDEAFLRDYLAESLCWTTGTAATYHDNVAGDTITSIDWLNCKAGLLAQDGCQEQNLVAFISPYAEASIRSIAAFVPNFTQAEKGNIGIPLLGYVHGVPVYVTNSIRRAKTVATTAAVTTGTGVTHTYTVAAGHGLVAGIPVTVSGVDADETVSTATAITSTTATTVVVTTSATNDGTAADGVGTITDASSWNIMMDIGQVFTAQQDGPFVRFVPDFQTTGDAIQLSTAWGRIGRAAYVRCLHTPAASA